MNVGGARPGGRGSIPVLLVAVVTLGSGILDLYSVMGPALADRHAILRRTFPLEFLHFSRFLTLLIGFALVISSVNVYRRNRRAFRTVLGLSILSVVFHLTKGLDYEEAALSAGVVLVLVLARRRFTVRSGSPDLAAGLTRLAVAFALALLYGIAGFWLLDPREFGINFTLPDAVHRTVRFLSMAGDPTITPLTRHARWFLDSLSLITATAAAYSLWSLFRPVLYRFRTLPQERAEAAALVESHGRSAQDYFKTWPDKSFFFGEQRSGFVAYRVGRGFAVALGDPVAPEARVESTVRGFAEHCRDNGWGHAFHQTLPDFLPIYRTLGYRKLKVGDEAIVDLPAFDLESRERKSLRSRTRQLEKQGVVAELIPAPVPAPVVEALREVSDAWLQLPGRRERRFTLGLFEPGYVAGTSVLVARDAAGRIQGFANLIPSHAPGEITIDLMRHRPDAPNGIMDLVFVKLFEYARDAGYRRFNLGLAPMSGFVEHEEPTPEERAVHYFMQHLNFLFSFSGLRRYKAKFATIWEPRYAVVENLLDLPRLAIALGAISEIRGGKDA